MRQRAIFLQALACLTGAAGGASAAPQVQGQTQAQAQAQSPAQPAQAQTGTPFARLSLSTEQLQALARQAPATPPPSTPPPQIASLDGLPDDIRAELGAEVADRGKPFAAGCVGADGEAHSRFVGGRIDGDAASVQIERGGFVHYVETLAFRRGATGRWIKIPSA